MSAPTTTKREGFYCLLLYPKYTWPIVTQVLTDRHSRKDGSSNVLDIRSDQHEVQLKMVYSGRWIEPGSNVLLRRTFDKGSGDSFHSSSPLHRQIHRSSTRRCFWSLTLDFLGQNPAWAGSGSMRRPSSVTKVINSTLLRNTKRGIAGALSLLKALRSNQRVQKVLQCVSARWWACQYKSE
jgi:hypothetical protein